MNRVVANALFLPEKEVRLPNLWGKLKLKPSEIYLRNSYLSLYSIGHHNPDVDLVLIYSGSIPKPYEAEFEKLNIRLIELPFEKYRVPERFPWRAAYYKLDAVEWLSENTEQFLLIDTDTVCVGALGDLWAEASAKVLLFETGHRLSHRFRQIINRFGNAIDGKEHSATHYGGEALAAPRSLATNWVENMRQVFSLMERNWAFFDENTPEQSDEMVVSLVAERMPNRIGSIKPYLDRYWTMDGFRLLSTNYRYNAVDIWHLPWEKRSGMLSVYRYLHRHDRLPSRGDMIRMLHLETGLWSALLWRLRKLKRALVGPKNLEV